MELTCPMCGHTYANNDRFCKVCGTALFQPNQAQKPYAGQANTQPTQVQSIQIPSNTPVVQPIQASSNTTVQPTKQTKASNPCIVIILGLVVICCIGGIIVGPSEPSQNASNKRQDSQLSQNVVLPTVTTEPSPTLAPQVFANVLRTANLRAQPKAGDDEPIIGRLFADSQVTLRGRNEANDWFVISSARGLRGWMSASLLNVSSEDGINQLPLVSTEEDFIPKVKDAQVEISAQSIDFQKKYGTTQASKGSIFLVVEISFENIALDPWAYNSHPFFLKDSNGAEYYIYGGSEEVDGFASIPGGSFLMTFAFEVPEKANGLTLHFEELSIPLTE